MQKTDKCDDCQHNAVNCPNPHERIYRRGEKCEKYQKIQVGEWHPNDDLPQTLQGEVMNLRRRMRSINEHAKDMFKEMDKFQDWLVEKYDHGVPAILWGHLLGITLGTEEAMTPNCEPLYENKVTGYCHDPFPEGYKFPSQRQYPEEVKP